MIKDNEHAGSSLDDFPETGSDTFIPGFSLPDPESIFTYTGGIQSPVSIFVLCRKLILVSTRQTKRVKSRTPGGACKSRPIYQTVTYQPVPRWSPIT
jgi:hypothetical protein